MGFLDKAKAAANDMVAKADGALSSAETSVAGGVSPKQAEPFLRDLGVLSYLEATGRATPGTEEHRLRCVEGIRAVESATTLNLQLGSTAPPPPGAGVTPPAAPEPLAPRAVAAPPPPPGAAAAPAPPPPPGTVAPTPPPGAADAPAPPPPPGTVAPPPPPSGG